MRFQRIRVDAFGRLDGLDTGPDPLPGLVVVTGPNEAGKSTFFQLLTTLLYGFYPASRDRNEYVPWSGKDASGSAVIRLAGGGCVEVERRLLSSPTARLTRDGAQEELRNLSLPWVRHVPRTVFGQVFALTLAELAGLDDETWARVQDRLLGAMGSSELRPAREVAAELEEEAGALWRPNRRGNQRIRELREEIRGLRARRREAAERDAELRATTRRRDQARVRLEEARRTREEERLAVDRVQSLAPIRAQLRRIAELDEAAGPPDAVAGLPPDPGRELEELEDRVAAMDGRLEEVEREAREPRRARSALGPQEKALLERRAEISSFVARAASWASERGRLRALRQEMRDVDRRLESAGSAVLAVAWRDAPRGPLLALPVADLREAVRRYRAAREERKAREAARHDRMAPTARRAEPAWRVAGVTAVLAGAVLAGVAWTARLPLVLVPAVAALAAGAVFLLRARPGPAGSAGDDTGGPARAAEEEARARVAGLLRDVPVAPARLEEPDETLTSGLERLQELLRDRSERAASLQDLEATLERADEEGRALSAALDQDASLAAEALARLLEGELRRAEAARDAARSADRELDRLERERVRLQTERTEARHAADRLRARLEDLGAGDARRGGEEAVRRLRARSRAGQLLDELERSHPDLDQRRERIARAESDGESWTLDADDLARRKARIQELTDEIEGLTAEAERLDHELTRMLDQETMDAVDGEIGTLLEEESRLLARRDRRWILARLVREADRRFREEHQPDLLRRAGDHMARLTGGRYRRMVADDGSGTHRFHLVEGDGSRLVPLAPPLSTGTLEQAWLALRLAIVDHLDEGQERLPLFVDEALVNWDPSRRERGLGVLAELSETRQIFVFTCHPSMAGRLEGLGARRLPLESAE